ncbi:hypothetical protein OFO16_16225 [Vibrio natriegens]|uniref:hypothetical protein n=1 Tax=Vibrio natriegens TaxID=691 RepID=UPI0021E6DC2D|nr:hypothetical protein [Vibrio natriegens]UYI49568.1 hypothetical protein OFO16_16225 [Vibrio natriegens]
MTEGEVALDKMNVLVVDRRLTTSILVINQLIPLGGKASNPTCEISARGSFVFYTFHLGSALPYLYCIFFQFSDAKVLKHPSVNLAQSIPQQQSSSWHQRQKLLFTLKKQPYSVGKTPKLSSIDTAEVTNALNDHRVKHLVQRAIPPNYSYWLESYLADFYTSRLPAS